MAFFPDAMVAEGRQAFWLLLHENDLAPEALSSICVRLLISVCAYIGDSERDLVEAMRHAVGIGIEPAIFSSGVFAWGRAAPGGNVVHVFAQCKVI